MKIYSYIILIIILIFFFFFFFKSFSQKENFVFDFKEEETNIIDFLSEPVEKLANPPEEIKGIYATTWTAITDKSISHLINLAKETEINSIVIDVKDYTGNVSFQSNSFLINSLDSEDRRINNLRELIELLHQNNIYTIARIAVFQDLILAEKRPDLAVQSIVNENTWKDRKGLTWLDPASQEVWNYILIIAQKLDYYGFDEINFDYIRFPSDGNMKDISYPFFDESTLRRNTLKEFFNYLSDNLRKRGIKISIDLFGLTTVNKDDLGIGQVLEDALPYFDFVCPMVYPSHYGKGFIGFENPAEYPYQVIKYSLEMANKRMKEFQKENPDMKISKIRPWLQDFDLGAEYNAEMIRKQKQAVYDLGLKNGWLLWDPRNIYTRKGLDEK
jgi:hypothetical protein